MGMVADAALKHGGHVIGVIPEKLVIKEVVHEQLPDLRVVKTMHERKALMAELSDGFIALPGGYGTFEEFFEVLGVEPARLASEAVRAARCRRILPGLLDFLDHTAREGFIRAKHRELVIAEKDAEKLLQRLNRFQPPAEVKWVR